MKHEDVIKEGLDLIAEYKESISTLTRNKVQDYRDILSALSVTLSIYMSDYYDDYIGAELKRKIKEARSNDHNMETMTAAKASIKSRIEVEELYQNEVNAEKLYKRLQSMLSTWNQILNSMASRMHDKNDK